MRVGNLTIEPDVLLAPMAAVTDLPFRTVIEEIGVGITITEFLSAHALVEGAKKAIDKMTPSLDGRRFGVQIFGREAEALARAAAWPSTSAPRSSTSTWAARPSAWSRAPAALR